MAAPDLMAPADEERRPIRMAKANALPIAWLLLLAAAAGLIAWLFANAEDTRSRQQVSKAKVEVPVLAPGAARPAQQRPGAPAGGGAQAAPAPEPTIRGPDPLLIENATAGPLPRVATDGRQPWRVYSRAFAAPETKPRIALVVTGLGLRTEITQQAIEKLPGEVSLAFSPYADKLQEWTSKARAEGHETLLGLGMEPANFPQHDPGPYTLLTSVGGPENVARLEWVMSRSTGYVGLVAEFGSRFATSVNYLLPVLEQMKRRGVMLVDSRASTDSVAARLARDLGLPRAMNDRFIDREPARAAVDARLVELERLARLHGQAVGFLQPLPVSLERIAAWVPSLEQKGIVLAPITAVANRQPD